MDEVKRNCIIVSPAPFGDRDLEGEISSTSYVFCGRNPWVECELQKLRGK
jgi:hypothetical protein